MFHDPDNVFCVLRITARGQRELITVLGHRRSSRLVSSSKSPQDGGLTKGPRGIGAMVSMLIASRKSLKYVDQRKLIAFGLIGLVLRMHSMTTWYPDMP
jgi:hypothetical protein